MNVKNHTVLKVVFIFIYIMFIIYSKNKKMLIFEGYNVYHAKLKTFSYSKFNTVKMRKQSPAPITPFFSKTKAEIYS